MPSSKPDYIIIGLVAFLLLVGLITLATTTIHKSLQEFGEPYFYLKRQLMSVFLGVILFLVVSRIDYSLWKKLSVLIFLGGLSLLVLPLIPSFQLGAAGAHRWVKIGPVSFQPIEFFKLALIFFLATFLSKKNFLKKEPLWQRLAFFGSVLGLVSIPLILQPDIGSLGLVCGISLFMLVGAGESWREVGILVGIGLLALVCLIYTQPYRLDRLTAFLHPEVQPQGIGYQIDQTLLALGSGGILGKGWGNSLQKFNWLPALHTDSIFAIIGEEWGFAGSIVLLFLFFFLGVRGLRVAKKSQDTFARLLALGLVSWFSLQTFINIGAISGLIPLTGMPLPFVSYGGSAIVSCLIGVGVLINISKK